jgi:hypothetical protein
MTETSPPTADPSTEIEEARARADALAAEGKVQDGLALLEDLARRAERPLAAELVIPAVSAYREAQQLGHEWEFFRGEQPIGTSRDVAEIRNRLIHGDLPADASCRKDHLGEAKPIEASLANEDDGIDLLYHPIGHHVRIGAGVGAGLAALIGLVGGFYQLGVALEMGAVRTLLFAVVFLGMWVAFGAVRNQIAGFGLLIACGFVLVALAGGRINFAFLGGLCVGMPIGVALSALVGAIPGALVGAVVGLVRRPGLPHLPAHAH